MFTEPLDVLFIFTVTTPVIGWVAYKKGYRKIQGVYAALGLSVTAYFLYELYREVAEKGVILIVGQLPFNPPLGACLKIDMFSVFMAFLFAMTGLFATVYSIKYMEHDTGLTEYYTLLLGRIQIPHHECCRKCNHPPCHVVSLRHDWDGELRGSRSQT
jgi:formate hydrogenlyase subunit 3/multisubunit Na+/H+ antiporter MnhD subunit